MAYEALPPRHVRIALDKAGFQIHVHAIGDQAAGVALDALEAAKKERVSDQTAPAGCDFGERW